MMKKFKRPIRRQKSAALFRNLLFGICIIGLKSAVADDGNAKQSVSDVADSTPAKETEFKFDFRPKWMNNMKTLGGRQFWGDVLFFHRWRIQQHVVDKHYRLLDGDNYRHASGTLDECKQKLAEIRRERKLSNMKGKVVVFVHGIVRSSKSFHRMHKAATDAGYEVFGFDYPSTRVSIAESAEYLHQSLSSLEGIGEINFVVHSMGGLVVRAYLKSHRDPRIHRMVMMGVPNAGAQMADHVKNWMLFRAIYGPAGQELVSDSNGLIANLPTPDFEFGVIAGSSGTSKGYNMWVNGDDDGTVSVQSTRLAGATDFIEVRSLHSFLMMNATVADVTVRFLKNGHFREDETRHPIPVVQKDDETPKTASTVQDSTNDSVSP